ncbi:MAG: beta-glucosidase, partial [Clostridia bacterium]|nr:beta-glucosidase [Clostridia bacterium]
MLAINIDDVVSALKTCAPYLIAFAVVAVLAIVAMIACMKLSKSKKYLVRTQAGLAIALTLVIVINLICFGPMSTLISLATGSGSISDESITEAGALGATIAEEGMVLLKNDGGALPLSQGTKLNLFGWSSTNPVYGGTGSGGLSDTYPTVSLLEGLQNAGFEVNQTLVDFYTGYQQNRPTVGMWGQDWTVTEPTMADYDAAGVFEKAKAYSDTAVIVIARSGGEGADLPVSLPEGEDSFVEGGVWGSSGTRFSSNPEDLDATKHYLELSTRERAMVERVTGEYDNVIVLINAANPMELGWLDEYGSIKAAVSFAGPGQTGFNALGNLLNGTVNPSGKTVDTFLKDLTQAPTFLNFGNTYYDNMDDLSFTETDWQSGESYTITPSFVNYGEGIYLGYKYYETAYAEAQAGNMSFDYNAVVQYPFGYGLSYTSFTQEMGAITEQDGVLSLDVTVTNTGSVAGKDVVEVYYNPPYVNGGIEKSAVNLAAFDKTDLLEPGASQTLTISFRAEDMASYDADGAGCYV